MGSVFNFWEPLHYFDKGHGFQTWELSPAYAVRSWAYVVIHIFPARLATLMLGSDKVIVLSLTWKVQLIVCVLRKRPSFFAVRIFLAVISVLAEAKFYRTVFEKINERVGRYLFFMLLFSAGMWNASTGKFIEHKATSVDPVQQHFYHPRLVCIPLR